MPHPLRKALAALAVTAACALGACVDHDYDLKNVDTDHIAIGDGMTLPLGTGIISAGKIINVSKTPEISVDSDGNYIISYQGDLPVDVPQDVRLNDVDLGTTRLRFSLPLGTGTVTVPSDETVDLPGEQCGLHFETSEQIVRLDSIRFHSSGTPTLLSLNLSLENLAVLSGSAMLTLRASFPERYEMRCVQMPGATFENGRLTFSTTIDRNFSGTKLQMQLLGAVCGDDDRIAYEASIDLQEGAVLRIGGDLSLKIDGGIRDLDYRAVYGQFDTQFSVGSVRINTDGLDGLFSGDDNSLSFADPRIRLVTESNIGIPLDAKVSLRSVNSTNGTSAGAEVGRIPVAAPATLGEQTQSLLWIGSQDTDLSDGYTHVACDELNDLLRITPQYITLDAEIVTSERERMFFPASPEIRLGYTVEIPLAPAEDFRATTDENADDIFDEDMIDYLFSSGSVDLTGTVTNSVPLNMDMSLIITDKNDDPVGIELAPQRIAGCVEGAAATSSPVKFTITRDDMDKMATARNLKIQLKAYADPTLAGSHLRPEQQVKLTLKITKTGGIVVNQ